MLGKAAAAATVLAMFAGALPASAAMNSSSITISTVNRGSIDNDTSAKSHTGENYALGSVGGRGGAGGDVTSAGDFNNGGADTGNGGTGGNGGAGGLVDTGDASATADTNNGLNLTDVEVAVPTDMNSSGLAIATDNNRLFPTQNHIDNDTRARARTGENTADGSVAGNADDAGSVEGGTGDNNNGGATTGNGGNGGAGGLGGTVLTGRADSVSGTVNVLNAIIVRVRN